MRKLLIPLLILCLLFSGCGPANTTVKPTSIEQAQTVAEQSLLAMGAILKATPGTADALFAAGTIDKTLYNQITDYYNKAIATFKVAVKEINAAKAAGLDPNSVPAYLAALMAFTGDFTGLQQILSGVQK